MKKITEIYFSEADIKQICKNRGFPYKEIRDSRAFQDFFLSDTGLEKVFSTLTEKELIFLHLINCKNTEVDIKFFESLYGPGKSSTYFLSFYQTYNPVFKEVKNNLIRKGILIYYQEHRYYETCKLESMVFRFLKEFSSFLPVITKPVSIKDIGTYNDKKIRKMLQDIGLSAKFNIKDKTLYFEKEMLSKGIMRNWQKKSWNNEISKLFNEKPYFENFSYYLIYILSGLKEGEWFHSDQIKHIMELWTGQTISVMQEVLNAGWGLGILLRSGEYFRLYQNDFIPYTEYLKIDKDGIVEINMKCVPLDILEIISSISNVSLIEANKNLLALPNIIKLGKIFHDHPIIEWLIKNSGLYANAVDLVKKRSKKQIIHKSIMIARVADLGLMVQIKKTFDASGKLIILSEQYIAFSKDLIYEMDALVNNTGNIIKRVK